MDRKSLPRLSDILEAISLIKDFVEDQNLDDFLKDIKCQKAVLFQFIIIGEAVKNIDEHLLNQYNYPWHIPKSFRNFIAHEYHNIKMERVYLAINELNTLYELVQQIIKEKKTGL